MSIIDDCNYKGQQERFETPTYDLRLPPLRRQPLEERRLLLPEVPLDLQLRLLPLLVFVVAEEGDVLAAQFHGGGGEAQLTDADGQCGNCDTKLKHHIMCNW